MRCKHCDGTGEVPDKITLECVNCQRKVTVTYDSISDLTAKCETLLCADCKGYVAP